VRDSADGMSACNSESTITSLRATEATYFLGSTGEESGISFPDSDEEPGWNL
jgi:hypothetical protein